jgi:VanZ family protein
MFAEMVKWRQHKIIPVIIWGIILLLHTWSSNLGALLRYQTISFTWVASPNYLSFFYLQDISTIHHYFIIVKTGHFVGFAIFDYLLFKWLRNHKQSLVLSISFALMTEILQLYFGRDGRMYDLVIDTMGIYSVYFLLKSHLLTQQSQITKSN